MEKNELEDFSIISSLPQEIIIRIFAVLPLQDRKNVRLTCKLWYEFSTGLSIRKNEKLVFRTDSNIEEIAEAMQKSNFKNFKFQEMQMNRLPVNIWEVCGHRIYSLEIFQCTEINVNIIKNIVIHCENLISFTFSDKHSKLGQQIFSSLKFLDELVEKGIQRTKLRTLAIFICDTERVVVLNKLFLVYPCITHFATVTMSPTWYCYLPVSVENLTFKDTPNSKHLIEMLIAKSEQGLRLRHLDGVFVDRNAEFCTAYSESFFNFISSQTNLNAIRLRLPRAKVCDETLQKKLLFHILESCPILQEFRIVISSCIPPLNFELEEFSHFLSLISKLQCLRLGFMVGIVVDPNVFLRKAVEPSLYNNFALKSLKLPLQLYSKVTDDLYAALLRHCPQLLHLEIALISDDVLQRIFEYLPKLQTLILVVSHDLTTDYGFTGQNASTERGRSIKRLQQLKHLEIDGFHRLKAIEDILLEFQFPYLECLKLEMGYRMPPKEVFVRLSSQIPNLRQLHISCRGSVNERAWRKELSNLGKYFKNLQCYLTFSKDSMIGNGCSFQSLMDSPTRYVPPTTVEIFSSSERENFS